MTGKGNSGAECAVLCGDWWWGRVEAGGKAQRQSKRSLGEVWEDVGPKRPTTTTTCRSLIRATRTVHITIRPPCFYCLYPSIQDWTLQYSTVLYVQRYGAHHHLTKACRRVGFTNPRPGLVSAPCYGSI